MRAKKKPLDYYEKEKSAQMSVCLCGAFYVGSTVIFLCCCLRVTTLKQQHTQKERRNTVAPLASAHIQRMNMLVVVATNRESSFLIMQGKQEINKESKGETNNMEKETHTQTH